MTYVLLSCDAPKKCIKGLEALGYTPLLLPPFDRLSEPVCTHADMLFFSYSNYIVTQRDYYKTASDVFDTLSSNCGISLILADDDIKKEYPHDIAYNAIALGKKLYSNTRFTSKKVSELFPVHIHTKQGYSACSTLALTETHVITADPSLSRVYEKNGINVTLVSNGSISLPPYDYGFIGGASGVFGNTVFFAGELSFHRDADIIKEAIRRCGMNYISLSNEPLSDIGGIKFFEAV